ncbi:hypothetical protein [Oceanirhabdus seepicola]|nr:hypothetical protein [Oceanirhabdus seepicola]
MKNYDTIKDIHRQNQIRDNYVAKFEEAPVESILFDEQPSYSIY